MRRVATAPLLALGVAVGLLVAACSSPAVSTDSRSLEQYGLSSSGQGTMAPGGQVQGARATAIATMMAGTPGPIRVQLTLRDMAQLNQQLQILAGNSPTAVQLLAMVQDASDLMLRFSQEVSLMTPQEQDQALGMMSDITMGMSQVVQTYASQVSAATTPGTVTPGATMQATPTPGMMSALQMMAAIQQLRQQEMTLANDQPTYADITNILDQMNQMLVSIRQQLGQLSTSELENLTGSMAQAMADLEQVMRTRIRMDIGSVPTVAPNQTVLPTLSTTPTLGPTTVPPTTTTPAATVAPTSAATVAPTAAATVAATVAPTVAPTVAATVAPTVAATVAPTVAATVAATVAPTVAETVAPTPAAPMVPTKGPPMAAPVPTP